MNRELVLATVLSESWTVYTQGGRLEIDYYWLIYLTQFATNKSYDNPIQIQFTKSAAIEIWGIIIWLIVESNLKFWCTIIYEEA